MLAVPCPSTTRVGAALSPAALCAQRWVAPSGAGKLRVSASTEQGTGLELGQSGFCLALLGSLCGFGKTAWHVCFSSALLLST